MKPLIGLNLNQDKDIFTLQKHYWDAVIACGGVPMPIGPLPTIDDVDAVLEMLDGLILTGGGDIDPARYGQKPHESFAPVAQPKHDADFQLAARALEFEIPILGVCYGMQLLTVLHGGDLVQDVPTMVKGALEHWGEPPKDAAHPIRIEKGSLIHRIQGCDTMLVNSHHHQAAGKTGTFRVTARSEDGVVEAVEPAEPGKSFLLGVQWHPERMTNDPAGFAPYRALVEAAGRYRDGSGFDVTIIR
ncbi:MAG: gamma-glutamyl-gamma-aminobutyrate hydrolase family protein [Planctomycetes bacterium]|nr:gamma-glutamyl-gamma-aminobutyrate hydrolase family protein [Planctomycetota bacterium]